MARRDRDENDRCDQATREGRERQRVNPEWRDEWCGNPMAEHNGRDGSQCRARRHADEAGIGKRVAEKPLHHGAGRGEGRADESGKKRSRQSKIDQNESVARRCRIGCVAERGGDRARQRVQ